MRRFLPTAALLLAIAVTVSACGRKTEKPPETAPAPPPPAETKPAPPPPPPPPPAPKPAAPTEDEIFAKKTLEELNAEKPLDDVFFGYDRTDLTEEARAALSKNLEWLKRWTSTRITVEGHADSRGTNEYNLALGDRRARAAMNYLVAQGVRANRITVISYGEDRPVCRESTEECWTRNRRAHFSVKQR